MKEEGVSRSGLTENGCCQESHRRSGRTINSRPRRRQHASTHDLACDMLFSWFFVPPADMGDHLLEPVLPGQGEREQAVISLVTQLLGSPLGWRALVERLRELIETDGRRAVEAIEAALAGRVESFEEQINLRRSTVMQVTLAHRAGPQDEAVTKLAAALVDLVRLTPEGYRKLRGKDPDEALRILAEGDRLVASFTAEAEAKRQAGQPSEGGYDELETIDLRAALGLESEG